MITCKYEGIFSELVEITAKFVELLGNTGDERLLINIKEWMGNYK